MTDTNTNSVNATTQDSSKEIVKGVGDVATIDDIIRDMMEISKNTDSPMTKSAARNALNLVKDAICAEIERGCKVQLTGFLTITPIYKPVRTVFNIATKQPMETKEGVMVMSKVGKRIKKISAAYSEDKIKVYRDEYESKKKGE